MAGRVMSEDRLKLRDADLEWREVEGDLVVLDLRESRYLAINRTGQALWAALIEGATQDDLIARLVETFDIERARAAADVAAFTTELESRGLLLHEPSSS
jgi:Coenzyme PQQ synthesis protein D (PqqD)